MFAIAVAIGAIGRETKPIKALTRFGSSFIADPKPRGGRAGFAILEPLVARDPGYAPAWALLAGNYGLAATYNPVVFTGTAEKAREIVQFGRDKAEKAAREAIRLDPKQAYAL